MPRNKKGTKEAHWSVRRQLSESFLQDCLEIWAVHGKGCLIATATEQPATFVKIMAGLLPKEIEATVDVGQSFIDVLQQMQDMVINNGNSIITIDHADADQIDYQSSNSHGIGSITNEGLPYPADPGSADGHTTSIFPQTKNGKDLDTFSNTSTNNITNDHPIMLYNNSSNKGAE